MNDLEALVGLLSEYLKMQSGGNREVPAYLMCLRDGSCVAPNTELPLYGLYDNSALEPLPNRLILEMVLINDTLKPSPDVLARYFNLDPEETALFFLGAEQSTAYAWAAGLALSEDSEQDNEEYDFMSSLVEVRWSTCVDLNMSYCFWHELIKTAADFLENDPDEDLIEQIATAVGLEDYDAFRIRHETHQSIARRWLTMRKRHAEVINVN